MPTTVAGGVPWWGVAVITAVAGIITGVTAAFINWNMKRVEIKAADRRQWDLHKFEIVSNFITLCDSIAEVTWTSDAKTQEAREAEAKRERVKLQLMSEKLGDLAQDLLGAAVDRSNAMIDRERTRIDKEKAAAFGKLIGQTQSDLARSRFSSDVANAKSKRRS